MPERAAAGPDTGWASASAAIDPTVAMLLSAPTIGVCVVVDSLAVACMNDCYARHLFGPSSRAQDHVGTRLGESLPEPWRAELEAVIRAARDTGRPALMRSICHGLQLYSWFQRMDHLRGPDATRGNGALEPSSDGAGNAAAAAAPVLVLTTHSSWDDQMPAPAPTASHEFVDAGVMGLGRLDVLSERELEVMALLGRGLSVNEAARVLHRSRKTIDHHRSSIHAKLGVNDRVALAELARRAGLTLSDVNRKRV